MVRGIERRNIFDKEVGVKAQDLLHHTKDKRRVHGRGLVCKWLVDDLKHTQSSVAVELDITQSAVSRLVHRGRRVEKEIGVEL